MNTTTRRLVPLAGILSVVLVFASFPAAGNSPALDASVGRLVAFYGAHSRGQIVSGVLMSLGALFFLVFAAALASSLSEARAASAACLGGGVLFSGGFAVLAGISIAIGDLVHRLEPSALQALQALTLGAIFPLTIGMSVLMLGAGVGALATDLLPRPLGWAAIGIGVLAAIPSHVLGGILQHWGIVPLGLLGIWTVAVSVLLARRER
jgi:hypothetical protein